MFYEPASDWRAKKWQGIILRKAEDIDRSQGDQMSLPKIAQNVAHPVFCQNEYKKNYCRGKKSPKIFVNLVC
jgi:hypothetical protein